MAEPVIAATSTATAPAAPPAIDRAVDAALVDRAFVTAIPRDFARDHGLIGQGTDTDGRLRLAVCATTSPVAIWNVGVRLARSVVSETNPPEVVHRAIDAAYERWSGEHQPASTTDEQVISATDDGDLDRLLAEADRDLLATEGKAPLVKLLDRLLFTAVQRGASDLHIQPTADRVLIRHRVDGVLDQGHAVPPAVYRPLVGRIKVIGRMDVAERLVPQDGRTTLRLGERAIDVRISTIPTAYGERVVLRLLDSGNQLLDVPALGMPAHIATPFQAAAGRSSGIVLVTGPTGSGKTTTLYATLRSLEAGELNIMTIEDPIEYELSSLGIPISQSQVNVKKGVNFANGLRHILRQDPDVIMVGEIRDAETARIAIQASLTGHLVFSTLHTNDAVSAVTRLIDLGVEPYLVASSLSAVLAQRLVRTCCSVCGGTGTVDQAACSTCQGNGYKGRTGLFELLTIGEQLRSEISRGASLDDLRRVAHDTGMRTFVEEGETLIAGGRTTRAEVERMIHHG
jgi:general secretion pathway protein E